MKCKCGKNTKGKPLCYYCYLVETRGEAQAKARISTLQMRNIRRHLRRPSKFQCDMGYSDCELRGFCNGDC